MQLPEGIENHVASLSRFLLGLGQKCIVAAIKKWKENKDKSAANAEKRVIDELEYAKSITTKVQQRITVSIRGLHLTAEQIRRILDLETNSLLKDEFAAEFLKPDFSTERIVEFFVRQDPGLSTMKDELRKLASAWIDEIDKAIASDAILAGAISLKSQRAVHAELKAVEEHLVKAAIRDQQKENADDQRFNDLFAEVRGLRSSLSILVSKEGDDKTPESLNSLHQQRFDRAKERLKFGNVAVAEEGFRSLIEELQALKSDGESELLLRCHLNVATCLWEQDKKKDAAEWFEKSFALTPNDWRARRGKAFALIFRDEIEPALQILRAIRIERPDEYEHVCNEAWILKNTGRAPAAIELMEARVFEDEYYYAILSFAYSRADRNADAERAAREAVRIAPKSDMALMALSFALGFPIVQRRMRRETLNFVPTDEERKQVLEAISYGEQAATSLRTNSRINSLIDVLSNLTAFYPAVGNCGKAIVIAEEALRYAPNDINILRNLWCSQMRIQQFNKAIETATKLETLDDPFDWWKRKAESLILAGKSQEVLDAWDAKKSDARYHGNVDLICIVARALSKRHRTQDGIILLSDALNRFPSNTCLLTERALLLESLDRPEDAKSDFETAENSSSAEYRAQMLLDFGNFLFRRHEWMPAAERMKLLGAESVHNPLFTNYLICIFNQGEFRQSLALAEDAIRQETDFVEDHHTIAARCYHICDNLARAKEQLDLLVAKGTTRELEHRKLLAWVYWRMDDLAQAYDVLLKCLKLKADDVDSLLLMSAVCSVLRRHEEAIENACLAIELDPQSVRAHTALVKAALSCPPNAKLKEKHLDAYFRSLAFLQDSKVGVLRAIPFEPDLHTFLGMVKDRAIEIKQFEEHFLNKPLPIGIFANRIGRSLFGAWVALMQHGKLKVRVAFGTTEEQQNEIACAMQSECVSIDLIALFTLNHLQLLPLLSRMFKRVFVHSSLLDSVVTDLRDLQQHPKTGGVSYINGKYVRFERTAEQNQITLNWLTEIRDFLKGPSVEITGLLPETLKTGNTKLITEVCGLACVAPMLVTREKSATLFSDDACLRSLGRAEAQVSSFCIQAFLRVATFKNLLTATEYQNAVIKLIKSNYAFISEDSGVLRRCYEIEKGRISQLALILINRVNSAQYNARSCLGLLSEFAVFLWRNKEPAGANTREEWLKEIWLAFSKSAHADALLFEFVAFLGVYCSTQPAVFFGILNNSMLEIPFINRLRRDLFQDMTVTANTMCRLSLESYPFWPKLAQEWLEHQKLNSRLANLGFFDNHNFDRPIPHKKPGKHAGTKSRKARFKAKRRVRNKQLKLMPETPNLVPRAKGNS